MLLEGLPVLVVVLVDVLGQCPLGDDHVQRRLEHEGHRVVGHPLGLELIGGGLLETGVVRPVGGHHRMERGSSRPEATFLGLVGTQN